MAARRRTWKIGTLLALTTLILVLAFFGRGITGQGIFYTGDAARAYLPQRIVLARKLAQGGLPWWTKELGAGYPLLAEGETGALYPPNWVLVALLPPELALNASIILHYLLVGAGMYCLGRTLRLSRAASLLSAMTLALGGFYIAHQSHLSILTAAAWLPWLLALTHRILAPHPNPLPEYRERVGVRGIGLPYALALAVVVALQFLAGHGQISYLELAATGAYALVLGWPIRRGKEVWKRWGMWLGGVALGTLGSAPQWLATAQLAALSGRSGGLEATFFTSYSLHPAYLATYLAPYVRGNPYPNGSVELMVYLGLVPLGLAAVGLWRATGRERWFWAALGAVALFLALGRWNPFYRYLSYLPVVNLFRVPARYTLWVGLGLATLAGMGLDRLAAGVSDHGRRARMALIAMLGPLLGGILVAVCTAPDGDTLVARWQWLPLALLGASLAATLLGRRGGRKALVVAVCATLAVDLYANAAMLGHTFSATMPRSVVTRPPASLAFFAQDKGLYRLYTKEEILPALSVMRESFFPDMALGWGLASANLYMPLIPRRYGEYLQELDAERLNRLNVKYYLIPQLLPVDEKSELYDVQNPYASLPANRWLAIPPTEVAALEVESYLSHAAALKDGTLAAELLWRDATGQEVTMPLRVGSETAEWAYERSDVRAQIAHSLAPLATTFPARSGFPPEEHAGHTYLARMRLAQPLRATGVMLRTALPEAFVRVERVRVRDASGGVQLLQHLLGLGNHVLVYRSEDVAIYRNDDALPRAYTVRATQARVVGGELLLPDRLAASETGVVAVRRYEDTDVLLQTHMTEPGYLILADMAYPGWEAHCDGAAVSIFVVDGLFRAVSLAPGEHEVTFTYHPRLP